MTQKAKVIWGSLFIEKIRLEEVPDGVTGEVRIISLELSKNGHALIKKNLWKGFFQDGTARNSGKVSVSFQFSPSPCPLLGPRLEQ